MDLVKIAERLDAEEKLKLKYRRFVTKDDEQTQAVRMTRSEMRRFTKENRVPALSTHRA